MNPSHRLPPGACWDHPIDHIEPEPASPYARAAEVLGCILEWIMRGTVNQRSLRFHLVALHACPQLLPCEHPSVSWCARIHGVSRQWAHRLHQDFLRNLGNRLGLQLGSGEKRLSLPEK